MKKTAAAMCALLMVAAPLAASAQGRGGGGHGGGGGFHGGGGFRGGGGGFRGGGYGGYRGGYGGYRGGYGYGGWGYGGWGYGGLGLGLGLGLGFGLAYDAYYPGYWGGYPAYGYGYEGDYGYSDPWAQDYGTPSAAPAQPATSAAPQACGRWIWRPERSTYTWQYSPC